MYHDQSLVFLIQIMNTISADGLFDALELDATDISFTVGRRVMFEVSSPTTFRNFSNHTVSASVYVTFRIHEQTCVLTPVELLYSIRYVVRFCPRIASRLYTSKPDIRVFFSILDNKLCPNTEPFDTIVRQIRLSTSSIALRCNCSACG